MPRQNSELPAPPRHLWDIPKILFILSETLGPSATDGSVASQLASMTATIDLDESLYRQLKALAALGGRKVKDLVAEGVRRLIEYRDPAPRTRPEKPFPRLNRKSPKPSKLAADTEFQAEQFRGAGLNLTLL